MRIAFRPPSRFLNRTVGQKSDMPSFALDVLCSDTYCKLIYFTSIVQGTCTPVLVSEDNSYVACGTAARVAPCDVVLPCPCSVNCTTCIMTLCTTISHYVPSSSTYRYQISLKIPRTPHQEHVTRSIPLRQVLQDAQTRLLSAGRTAKVCHHLISSHISINAQHIASPTYFPLPLRPPKSEEFFHSFPQVSALPVAVLRKARVVLG